MLDASAIKELSQQVARPVVHKVRGVEHAYLPKRNEYGSITWENDGSIPDRSLPPTTLEFHTLSGLVEFMHFDGHLSCALHVVGPSAVDLIGLIENPLYNQRYVHGRASMALQGFPFNSFLEREPFQILMQTQFVDTPEREELLKFIASVKSGPTLEVVDDRVTQTVTTRRGVQMSAATPLPSPINLKPYRTFREVEQPESRFVFRARGGDAEGPPQFGLFEADGETWQLAAMESIRAKLDELKPGIPILA